MGHATARCLAGRFPFSATPGGLPVQLTTPNLAGERLSWDMESYVVFRILIILILGEPMVIHLSGWNTG